MKLSLSFLSTVLLAPFSEASVALTDRWAIGTVEAVSSSVFEYQGMSKAWLGTDPNLKIRATFYDGGCKVDGTLDLSLWYAATGYNPPAATPAAPDVTLEGGESAFTDPSLSWDEANLRLNFATNPRVMTAMGDFGSDGVLVYCVRLGLYAGGTSIDEINFQESIVTLNITMNGTFEILSVGVAPKAQGESTAAQEYKVTAELCDATTGESYDQGSEKFNQGAAIVVCINLDEAGLADQVEITSVDEFTWTRDGTSSQTAVGTPGGAGFGSDGLANNGLTMMTMTAAKDKATITSILFAKFYESVGTVTANGSVTMAFGASATPLLQLNGAPIDFDSSSDPPISSSATELSLVDDSHADIDATTLGNFGVSDYSIEFTFSSLGGEITADRDWGALFMLCQTNEPWYGPHAFVWDNGAVEFKMRYDDAMTCDGALPDKNTGPYTRVLKFERIESTLNLTISTIDGDVVKKCTYEMTKTIDTSLFVDAPMRFGGNIDGNSDNLNLRAQLSNIKLVGSTSRRRLGGTNNNNNRRHLQEGGSAKSAFDVSVDLNKAEDGPVALQQTAGAGVGTSITVVATIVGLVSALLLA